MSIIDRNAFGESNVQTAKHYGNLGRLYQSMKRFKVPITCDFFFYILSAISHACLPLCVFVAVCFVLIEQFCIFVDTVRKNIIVYDKDLGLSLTAYGYLLWKIRTLP